MMASLFLSSADRACEAVMQAQARLDMGQTGILPKAYRSTNSPQNWPESELTLYCQ